MMSVVEPALSAFEEKASRGEAFEPDETRRLLAEADLISIGAIADAARRRASDNVVTYGRVLVVQGGTADGGDAAGAAAAASGRSAGAAGEVRVAGRPSTLRDAGAWVEQAREIAGGLPVTAFSLADLMVLAGGSLTALTDAARSLRAAGAEAVAEVPLDRFETAEQVRAAIEAAAEGGLQAWRWTIEAASSESAIDLAYRAAVVQRATGAARAFAPLRRQDDPTVPSTGYDDVRAVALARVMCPAIPAVQVDWPLYGPKLAQVAIGFGAGDIDGIAAFDQAELGPRRAAEAEIRRQIEAAGAVAAPRNGRFERLT
jgi:aminodeoxyfutalosine synthase